MTPQRAIPLVLVEGFGLTEGPVFRESGDIVFVSIDGGKVFRISEGVVDVLAITGGGPNGAAEDSDGSLFIAQSGSSQTPDSPRTAGVQVVRPSGEVEWLTQEPLSPNDLCVGPDGLLYVTDPTRDRRDDGRLWRCDPRTGESELLASVGWYPNGIGFGLEDDALYVASTGDQEIRRFPLTPSGLGRPETVIRMSMGYPDGFAFDVEGNVLVAAVADVDDSGSLQTWSPEGELLDLFRPVASRYYTNVALGPDERLIMTDASEGTVLMVEEWPAVGLLLHPFRARSNDSARRLTS